MDQTALEPRSRAAALRAAFSRIQPTHLRYAVIAAGLALSLFFAIDGSLYLDSAPPGSVLTKTFDGAMLRYGLGLLALLVASLASWRSLPLPERPWLPAPARWARAHWPEITLGVAVFAVVLFVRFYRIGSFPPHNLLCCEEHINGGVAWKTLHGERPILFPVVRYSTALSFKVIGQTALGERFPSFPLMLLSLVGFYLLMRELTRPPAALFATVIFGVAHWTAIIYRTTFDMTVLPVWMAYFLVRGLRTGGLVNFLAVGVLAGLTEYEYDVFKQIPMVAAIYVALAALAFLFGRRPFAPGEILRRAGRLSIRWALPLVVFALAVGTVMAPMIVAEHRGQDLYLNSLHRQQGDKGLKGWDIITPAWRAQTKWAIQLWSPIGKKTFPTDGAKDFLGNPFVDPLTATLVVISLVGVLVTFWRPYRLFFAGWFIGTLLPGALILSNFSAWKFVPLIPVAAAMTGLVVNDVDDFSRRRLRRWGPAALYLALVAGAAFMTVWNVRNIDRVAGNQYVQREYGNTPGRTYTLCRYLQDRPQGNYTYLTNGFDPTLGLARPHASQAQEAAAWGDYVWACQGLQGMAAPALSEMWPLPVHPPGAATFAFVTNASDPTNADPALRAAYPDLPQPHVINGPAGSFEVTTYELPADSPVLTRHGLRVDYRKDGAEAASGTTDGGTVDWTAAGAPAPPFQAHLQGLVYAAQPGWRLQVQGADPAGLRIDGHEAISPLSEEGWHLVELTVQRDQSGGALSLQWLLPDGSVAPIDADSTFPLQQVQGWLHTRRLRTDDGTVIPERRLDFSPHAALVPIIEMQAAGRGGNRPLKLAGETWGGVWQVDQDGIYTFQYSGAGVSLRVDGQLVEPSSAAGQAPALHVTLARGPHTIQIDQQTAAGQGTLWVGADLVITRQTTGGEVPVTPLVTPY